MTYCVGLLLNEGLVFMSDTRTNAGVDNISRFRKMFTWQKDDDRLITIMAAGNLATTQAVISQLEERVKAPKDRVPSIWEAPTMFRVAQLVGETLRETIKASTGQQASDNTFNATLIVGGQIKGMEPRLFLIYPEGNFIEASKETPFFQIGETKYGRPIIVRVFNQDMQFEEAIRLLLVSFDSTIRANLSVGPPLDLQVHQSGNFNIVYERRIEADDPDLLTISSAWDKALTNAFSSLPQVTL